MNKKLFIGLILVILAIVSLGGAYALDLGVSTNDSQSSDSSLNTSAQTVTIDGIDFNIPAGFEEFVTNSTTKYNRTIDGIAYFSTIKNYDDNNDSISISVSKNPSHKATVDTAKGVGGDSETINGVDGYLEYHPQNVTNFTAGNYIYTLTIPEYYTFSYVQDDKLVVITTTDKNYFSEVIIEESSFWDKLFS